MSDPIDKRWEAAKAGELLPPDGFCDDDVPVDAYEEQMGPRHKPAQDAPAPMRALAAAVSGSTVGMKEALDSAINRMRDRAKRKGELAGASCGYRHLDKLLDGWQRGCLYVAGGRAGMGKSIFALNVALGIAKSGQPVDYYTLEMTAEEQVIRALFCWSHVQSHRMKEGTLRQQDWTDLTMAAGTLAKMAFRWDESCGLTVEQIEKRIAERTKAGVPQFLVVIDHVLLMSGSEKRADRRLQIDHITRKLKEIAKTYNVAILALTQLNRALESRTVKDKRPQVSDLKESGSFEQDADAIILLYRADHYEKDRTNWTNELDVMVEKVRGGEPGMVKLRFDGNSYRLDAIDKSST